MSSRIPISFEFDPRIKLSDEDFLDSIKPFLQKEWQKYDSVIFLSPYAPLITAEIIEDAYQMFQDKKLPHMVSVRETQHEFVLNEKGNLVKDRKNLNQRFFCGVKAFLMVRPSVAQGEKFFYILHGGGPFDIRNYQDWWLCESLLKRKKVIFRVIGHNGVGMGHIYRALALAHENTEDEILFVCDPESDLASTRIIGSDYPLEVIARDKMEERILELAPDLVINDILDTDAAYIQKLKDAHIKVVNFEDLGSGATVADLTINELYDEPLIEGGNIRWGHKYSFLRDEFVGARVLGFPEEIKDVLVTFGGTDPANLTMKTLQAIVPLCKQKGIGINTVAGPGYLYRKELEKFLKECDYNKIVFTNETGVMSGVMEKTQLGISSNGRTVYELAHMNIPSIIIAQHERERTHLFSHEQNGFFNLGIYEEGRTEKRLNEALEKICSDRDYREKLFQRISKFDFVANKKRVVKEIFGLVRND